MQTSPAASAKVPAWPRVFLALLQEVNPDYRLNRNARGRFTECLRPLGPVSYSQNTVCIRGQYSHGFAVTLTDQVNAHLNSPFWAGARFDHNHTIFCAFEKDLGATVRGAGRQAGLHSTHARRSGADAIVRQCTANAEQHLAPHYLAQLQRGTPLLMGILELLMANPGLLDDQEPGPVMASFRKPAR
ncbi:hypothetical protein [Lysobacter sp. FW306-1B-D06B]|uniref:hypothetical protein n=1 Tax=Lysobacter sp. FW306-1B-D06B TaxID=3140250 RepID=UPI0031406DA2